MVSEARVAAEDLQGRHKRRKNKEERMKSVLEGRLPFVPVDSGITTACIVLLCMYVCCNACMLGLHACIWHPLRVLRPAADTAL